MEDYVIEKSPLASAEKRELYEEMSVDLVALVREIDGKSRISLNEVVAKLIAQQEPVGSEWDEVEPAARKLLTKEGFVLSEEILPPKVSWDKKGEYFHQFEGESTKELEQWLENDIKSSRFETKNGEFYGVYHVYELVQRIAGLLFDSYYNSLGIMQQKTVSDVLASVLAKVGGFTVTVKKLDYLAHSKAMKKIRLKEEPDYEQVSAQMVEALQENSYSLHEFAAYRIWLKNVIEWEFGSNGYIDIDEAMEYPESTIAREIEKIEEKLTELGFLKTQQYFTQKMPDMTYAEKNKARSAISSAISVLQIENDENNRPHIYISQIQEKLKGNKKALDMVMRGHIEAHKAAFLCGYLFPQMISGNRTLKRLTRVEHKELQPGVYRSRGFVVYLAECVIDEANEKLVAARFFGPKGSIRSAWAGIMSSHTKIKELTSRRFRVKGGELKSEFHKRDSGWGYVWVYNTRVEAEILEEDKSVYVVHTKGKGPQMETFYAVLDRNVTTPMKPEWAEELFLKGVATGMITMIEGKGIRAWRVSVLGSGWDNIVSSMIQTKEVQI